MTEPSFPHWVSDLRYVKRVRIKQVPVPSSLEQNPKLQQGSGVTRSRYKAPSYHHHQLYIR